jgi:hypothetical protein
MQNSVAASPLVDSDRRPCCVCDEMVHARVEPAVAVGSVIARRAVHALVPSHDA